VRDREQASGTFFAQEAERVARLCHRMAERFARGGRLVAFGYTPTARSDARHVAVEFVHPVIVGKAAVPALGLAGEGGPLAGEGGPLAGQVALEAEPDDIAMAFGDDGETLSAVTAARGRGCPTIAFARGSGAEWEFDPGAADAYVHQEIVETL
jgi:D-sedoheptulose 7-phosphate isomerase